MTVCLLLALGLFVRATARRPTTYVNFVRAARVMPPPRYQCRRTTLKPTFEQCTYAADEDRYVSEAIITDGQWDGGKMTEMRAAWLYAAERGNIALADVSFVDVGANLGIFSLYAAASGLRRIVAFEPLPPNIGIFTSSVLRNAGFNESIRIVPAGAGARRQLLPMWIDLHNRGGSSFSSAKIQSLEAVPAARQHVEHRCRLVPLDSVVATRVHVMKIDVEGFETCVFAGAQELFHTHGVVMLFIELWGSLSPCYASNAAFIDALLALGYEFHADFHVFRAGKAAMSRAQVAALTNSRGPVEPFLVRRDLL